MKYIKWVGEPRIPKYFGRKGFKCLCVLLLDEINILRQKAGLPQYTLQQVLSKMDALMITYASDEINKDV